MRKRREVPRSVTTKLLLCAKNKNRPVNDKNWSTLIPKRACYFRFCRCFMSACVIYLQGTGSCCQEKGDGGSEAEFRMQVERSDGTAVGVAVAFGVGAAVGGPLQSAVAGEAWWDCSRTRDRRTVVGLAQTAS